jgi:hypothetical protein
MESFEATFLHPNPRSDMLTIQAPILFQLFAFLIIQGGWIWYSACVIFTLHKNFFTI